MSDRLTKKGSKRRKVIEGYAACGSHGKPWVPMINRVPELIGRLAIYETEKQARAEGPWVHRVKIYIESESLP